MEINKMIKNKQHFLSALINSYDLIKYNTAIKMTEFIDKYAMFKESVYCANFMNLYKQYCKQFGDTLSVNPKFKINDSMAAFMSYTFGMNAAIKEYIQPTPPISPLI